MVRSTISPRASQPDQDEEREYLLLKAAQILPEILAAEFQSLAPVYEASRTAIAGSRAFEVATNLVRALKDPRQVELWTTALKQIPSFSPLSAPVVTFGHSLFERKDWHSGRGSPQKRLGMVDLQVDFAVPDKGFRLVTEIFDTLREIQTPHDAYTLHTFPIRLLAVAFPSNTKLGRILEQVEISRDNIRIDAESRHKAAPPLVVILNRREVFDAVITHYDALLLGETTEDCSWRLERVTKLINEKCPNLVYGRERSGGDQVGLGG